MQARAGLPQASDHGMGGGSSVSFLGLFGRASSTVTVRLGLCDSAFGRNGKSLAEILAGIMILRGLSLWRLPKWMTFENLLVQLEESSWSLGFNICELGKRNISDFLLPKHEFLQHWLHCHSAAAPRVRLRVSDEESQLCILGYGG